MPGSRYWSVAVSGIRQLLQPFDQLARERVKLVVAVEFERIKQIWILTIWSRRVVAARRFGSWPEARCAACSAVKQEDWLLMAHKH